VQRFTRRMLFLPNSLSGFTTPSTCCCTSMLCVLLCCVESLLRLLWSGGAERGRTTSTRSNRRSVNKVRPLTQRTTRQGGAVQADASSQGSNWHSSAAHSSRRQLPPGFGSGLAAKSSDALSLVTCARVRKKPPQTPPQNQTQSPSQQQQHHQQRDLQRRPRQLTAHTPQSSPASVNTLCGVATSSASPLWPPLVGA
jgi:hypothetical protein